VIPASHTRAENRAVMNEATKIDDHDSENRSNNVSPAGGNKLSKKIDIRSIGDKDRVQLLESIERRCLDLCQQIYEKFLTDGNI